MKNNAVKINLFIKTTEKNTISSSSDALNTVLNSKKSVFGSMSLVQMLY